MAHINIQIFILQCAICWKYFFIYSKTRIVRGLYLKIKKNSLLSVFYTKILLFKYYANPYIVKYYYKKYDQQITKGRKKVWILKLFLVGISETIRTQKRISYMINKLLLQSNNENNHVVKVNDFENLTTNQNNKEDKKFNEWLAGLIDGDGCFGITQKKYTNCEITVGLEDEKMLRQIQNKFGGSVSLRSGAKAIRYRLQNREGMIKLVNSINGNIRQSKRLVQLHKVCLMLDIQIQMPIQLTIESAWFSGFFDADGTINFSYRDKDNKLKIRPQLTISVTNKYLQDLEPFSQILGGNIYFDKAQNGYYKWSINNEVLHTKFSEYNKTNPSRSFKGRRVFLIKEFYKLYNLKAFRYGDNTLLFKSWLIFEKKWNKFKYK